MSLCKRIILLASLALTASTAAAGDVEDRLTRILTERLQGLQVESIRKLPQADLYEVIYNGKGSMPAWGKSGQLNETQIRSAILKVRTYDPQYKG